MKSQAIAVACGDDRDGPAGRLTPLRLALDADGRLPALDDEAYDVCLTIHSAPPRPWVAVASVAAAAAEIAQAASAHAVASSVLLEVLRVTQRLPLDAALSVESLAYSTLLAGADFRGWLARRPVSAPPTGLADAVHFGRENDVVTLTLADPVRLNAYSSVMRDALAYALDSCLLDPTRPAVVLRGRGRAFCAGGALDEFGRASDLAEAHRVRMLQSAALRVAALGERVSVAVHGAVVGSGVEIAAAAARVVARRDAWFWLPELEMGLIPGAGGTATISRRIGRHRTAYLVLSGARLSVDVALAWGLVDEVVPS